ncbi:MAG: hypothetical protein QMD08_08035 [Actinomycetota bacterium]|nr:hypothetical protein [Actinomycetota bacterium]
MAKEKIGKLREEVGKLYRELINLRSRIQDAFSKAKGQDREDLQRLGDLLNSLDHPEKVVARAIRGYVLVNACHPTAGICLCDEEGEIYNTAEEAKKERDRLREEHKNPEIEVYGLVGAEL